MVVVLGVATIVLLAQDVAQVASETVATDWTNFIDIGVVGVVFVLILTKRLAPYWVVEHERERASAAEAQRDRLIDTFQNEVVPSLTRASDALAKIGSNDEASR